MEVKELIVVLGYGCHLHQRMRNYLRLVANYAMSKDDVIIITTGGFTNPVSAPGMSEARIIGEYLIKLGVETTILLEEEARTTKENLMNVRSLLSKLNLSPQSITIFGDKIRGFKVKFLARKIFKRELKFIGYDLTQDWKAKARQILIGTPVEIFGYYLPFIEKIKLKKRLKGISKL